VKDILQPLAKIPGVRMAALISEDGVPIASTRGVHATLDESMPLDRDDELIAFTALASGWHADLRRAAARLSWNPPRRMILRASKNELVLLQAPTSVVLVVLERGASAEDLRVPMEGALARMQRLLREMAGDHEPDAPADSTPGLFPGSPGPEPSGATHVDLARNGVEPAGGQ